MKVLPSPVILGIIDSLRKNTLPQNKSLIPDALQEGGDSLDAVFTMGISCAQSNRLSDALLIFECLQLTVPGEIRIAYNLGLIYAMLGRHQSALEAYDLALLINPDDTDTLVNKSSSCNELKDSALALTALNHAITLKADIPEAWMNKGIALANLEFFKEAIDAYEQAIKLRPDYWDAWTNKSISLARLGLYSDALDACDQAVRIKSDDAKAYFNLGLILGELKLSEEALIAFNRAVLVDPQFAEAHNNRGIILLDLKRSEEALVAFDKAIYCNHQYAEAYNNKGNALSSLKLFEAALVTYDQSLSYDTNSAETWSNKGTALHKLKRYEDALYHHDRAIKLNSNYFESYCNKAGSLYGLLRYEEALKAYDKAISISPQYADAYAGKGKTLQALKRYDEALASNQEAIKLNSDLADTQLDLAFLHLRMLNFRLGWEKYEWRWAARDVPLPSMQSSKPLWSGSCTSGTVLVQAEQGVGDQVLFSSMFQELSKLDPKMIISVDKRLLPIYKRSFPDIEFVDGAVCLSEHKYDVHIPMGGLMKFLRPQLESFASPHFPYLVDDASKTAELRARFKKKDGKQPLCGISWRSINREVGDHKSIPLNKLIPLLRLDQFQFVNLQYGDVDADIQRLKDSFNITIQQTPGLDLFENLDDSVSLIQACDLIISSSNTTAHIAGALNKPTILILPYETGKFWYWHEVQGHSLCYPSVRVFSQVRQGSWDEVIDEVGAYMESLSFE